MLALLHQSSANIGLKQTVSAGVT